MHFENEALYHKYSYDRRASIDFDEDWNKCEANFKHKVQIKPFLGVITCIISL